MAAKPVDRVLVIEARYYEDIANELLAGAKSALDAAGAEYEVVTVPGALEIPTTLAMALDAGLMPYGAKNWKFHGAVALGTVIRGETSHYDIVAGESSRWLMQLATQRHVPVGNGILTVENADQAWARARGGRDSKGAAAADASLSLIQIMRNFHGWD